MPHSSFEIRPPAPYSLERTAARLARLPNGTDRYEGGQYRRLLFVDGGPLLVSLTQTAPPSRPRLRVGLEGAPARRKLSQEEARKHLERSLGVAAPVQPFYRALGQDPLLGDAIRSFRGLRVQGPPDAWEALVGAVLSQQVNLVFAYSILRDLVESFGRRARIAGETWFAFPRPERLARETEARLRTFRLSSAKAATLLRLARAFRSGALSDAELRQQSDEEIVEGLIAIKGIGRWTAETTLVRGLDRPDAFPAGDLGVVKYLAQGLLGHSEPASEQTMRSFSEAWRPHRSLALVYAYALLAARKDSANAKTRRSAGDRGA